MLAAAQAIDAITALIRNATEADARVYSSRAWPLSEADLPAWRVEADEEEIEPAGIAFPARQRHRLTVLAHAYARATANLDDVLHSLAAAALAALFTSRATATLAPLNCSMSLQRIERDMVTEGEAALGRITLSLRVEFHTFNNAPEAIV